MTERPRYGRDMMRPSVPVAAPVVKPARRSLVRVLREHWKLAILAVAVVAGISWLAYGYMTTRSQLAKLNSNSGGSEMQQIVNDISRYMVLPDERPTLATVNDAAKLKGQEFFKNAQDGDKVLIFSQSGRALLYRPSMKKIIEYSKVDLSASK